MDEITEEPPFNPQCMDRKDKYPNITEQETEPVAQDAPFSAEFIKVSRQEMIELEAYC